MYLQSQKIFVLFIINGRIRLLPLKSEILKGVPFVSRGRFSLLFEPHHE